MRFCSIKRASTEKILDGIWTPFRLEYYPFTDVDEFCIPCYRWRYLSLMRGNRPFWGMLLKYPNDPTQEIRRYYKISMRFKQFSVVLLRMISRGLNPNQILRDLRNPVLLLDNINDGTEIDEADEFAMELVSNLLYRINNLGILSHFQSNLNTLYNLQILNEDFDVYRQDPTPITLQQSGLTIIGINRRTNPEIYTWRGNIPIRGIIPILDLDNQQIRAPIPISGVFFDPNLDLGDQVNTPAGIRLFFINKEFHKLWILRESLAQLVEDNKLPLNIHDSISNESLFETDINLNQYNFRNFNIILDTIDHSETLDPSITYRDETGQAAIIHDILYRSYPGTSNSFQTGCLFQVGQIRNQYSCPLTGTQGCGMRDRRIRNNHFPRDRIESNVYRFLKLLRDEAVFKHEVLYKITRLYPQSIFELNQFSDFWIGEIFQDSSLRWNFRSLMPEGWELPRISEKEKYNVCLISPLCYEKGYQVKFSSALGDGLFLINPITTLNPWILDFPFNQSNPTIGNTVNCIVGRLSIEENLYNINRQKRQLIQSIQYQNRGQTEIDILENRLSTRYKRVGMATFGRYARFV